jgi:small subunit ribosomal protein S20
MANIKSAQKRARQNVVRKARNLNRRSSIKTVVKKVLSAIEANELDQARVHLKDVEGQLARAASKNVVHKKTAMRKTSRLAKRISAAAKAVKAAPKKEEAAATK